MGSSYYFLLGGACWAVNVAFLEAVMQCMRLEFRRITYKGLYSWTDLVHSSYCKTSRTEPLLLDTQLFCNVAIQLHSNLTSKANPSLEHFTQAAVSCFASFLNNFAKPEQLSRSECTTPMVVDSREKRTCQDKIQQLKKALDEARFKLPFEP